MCAPDFYGVRLRTNTRAVHDRARRSSPRGPRISSPLVRFSMTPKDEHDSSRERVVAALADSPPISEEQLRLILDALPAPIAYLDADERYRFDNKSHERWFGRPRAEFYGRSLREVFGEEQYAQLRPFVERV